MRNEPTHIEVAPVYGRLFELQNQLIYMTLCMEKVDTKSLPFELRRSIERTLKLLRDDW